VTASEQPTRYAAYPISLEKEMMNSDECAMTREAYKESVGRSDPAAVRHALEQVMNAHERAPEWDPDKLLSLGVQTPAEHEDADVAVLDWLVASPGNKRVDIASALLLGMWTVRCRRKSPFPAANVERLIAARRGLALDDDAEYSYVLALGEAVRHLPEPLRGRALDEMRDAQQRVSPGAQGLIEQLLQRLQ
jgi:hypothetical protein